MKLRQIYENYSDQPILFMLVGLPAAGKSTWIKQNTPDAVILSTDNYIEDKASEMGKTYHEIFQSQIKHASRNLNVELNKAIESGKDIVWDQTNVAPTGRKKKLKGIPDRYYKVAVVFDVEDAELERRLAKRAEETGKSIPPHVLSSMRDSFIYPTREEGFDKVIKGN